ncbi:hypothetical protein EV363DRAFT_1324638 [Boletus edulis]|nr:hypothetical protein EV363DRAFT_1324638 [Boletus edulis]
MRTSPFTQPAPRLDVRSLKRRVKRSFAKASKRGVGIHTRYIGLPRHLWDRIVLLMFICCLFVFLHAFFGFGVVDEDLRGLNDASALPRATLFVSSPRNQGSGASNRGRTRARGASRVTRVMVDWHGNYELFSSTTSAPLSPASIPQDAFPDPTPPLAVKARGRVPDEGFPSMTTDVKTPVDISFGFYGVPYDPFRLEFGDSVDEGEVRGLYPIAGPPRTAQQRARTRRFGRCLPEGEDCL